MEKETYHDQRWFRHGAIEVQFTPIRKTFNGWVYFHTRNVSDGYESLICGGELALLLSLDTDEAKTLSQISEDFTKWTNRIREDNKFAKNYVALTRSGFYGYMGSIEEKFGFCVIKKVGQGLWRLTLPEEQYALH